MMVSITLSGNFEVRHFYVDRKITVSRTGDTYYFEPQLAKLPLVISSLDKNDDIIVDGGNRSMPIKVYIDNVLVKTSTSRSDTYTWRVVDGAELEFGYTGSDKTAPTSLTLNIKLPVPVVGYTLSYSTEHGTAPSPISDVAELTSVMLPALTETGYNFIGWYYESTFTTQAQVGDTLSADTTLYAKWEETGGGSILDVTYGDTKIIDSLEVTPPVTVTYNSSTIATLNEGDAKTLNILGSDNKPKILAAPIVIGGKTIPDVDTLGRKWELEYNPSIEVRSRSTLG